MRAAGLRGGAPLRFDAGRPVCCCRRCFRAGVHHHRAGGLPGHPPDDTDAGESPEPGAAARRPRDIAALGPVRLHPGAPVQCKTEFGILCHCAGGIPAGMATRPPATARIVVGGRAGGVGAPTCHRVERGARLGHGALGDLPGTGIWTASTWPAEVAGARVAVLDSSGLPAGWACGGNRCPWAGISAGWGRPARPPARTRPPALTSGGPLACSCWR